VVARLTARAVPTRVLLISGNDDSAIAHAAITGGAAGFLSKDAEEAEIADAILAVAAGRSVLSPALQSGVLDLIRRQVGPGPQLSARETQLIALAADGLSTGEIAARLHLSPNTVKTYWQRLYEKLGTSDRASAVAEALRRGLVE
jgi:two-component system nitrate/nitrite response regulator NarL